MKGEPVVLVEAAEVGLAALEKNLPFSAVRMGEVRDGGGAGGTGRLAFSPGREDSALMSAVVTRGGVCSITESHDCSTELSTRWVGGSVVSSTEVVR